MSEQAETATKETGLVVKSRRIERVSAEDHPYVEACFDPAHMSMEKVGAEVEEDGEERIVARDVEAMEAEQERGAYTLSRRQAKALDLMLRGMAMAQIARELGVSRLTVYRWRNNHPLFLAVYARLTAEL